jgi:hypothetical protein
MSESVRRSGPRGWSAPEMASVGSILRPMAEGRTYWRIETQSEGVRDFFRFKEACEYAQSAPLILRIEERRVGDSGDGPPLRRLGIDDFGEMCGDQWSN